MLARACTLCAPSTQEMTKKSRTTIENQIKDSSYKKNFIKTKSVLSHTHGSSDFGCNKVSIRLFFCYNETEGE